MPSVHLNSVGSSPVDFELGCVTLAKDICEELVCAMSEWKLQESSCVYSMFFFPPHPSLWQYSDRVSTSLGPGMKTI